MLENPNFYYGLAIGILLGFSAGVCTMAIIQIARDDCKEMLSNRAQGPEEEQLPTIGIIKE